MCVWLGTPNLEELWQPLDNQQKAMLNALLLLSCICNVMLLKCCEC